MSTKRSQGGSKKTTKGKSVASTRKTKASAQNEIVADINVEASDNTQINSEASTQSNQPALTESKINAPAKAQRVSPAVKQTKAPVVKQSNTPVLKDTKAPAIKEKTEAPVLKEVNAPAVKQAKTPVIKEKAEVVIKEHTEIAVKEHAKVPATTAPTFAEKEKAKVTTENKAKNTTVPNLGPNPYLPHVATVLEVVEETHNIKTFRVRLDDEQVMQNFTFEAGQVGQLSLFGVGESTFVINSPPSNKDYLQFSVMRTGEVTEALHKLSAGDKVGVRAPLGKAFPREDWKGKDIFFVGGGIGMAPIRTIMLDVLEHHKDYGKVSLLYGARSPKDMAFSYEVKNWLEDPRLNCHLTIDNPFEGWEYSVGLIPNILTELKPDPKKTIAVLCGPPIMIKFTVQALEKMNFPPESIITTLEKRMKCGIGICGRCNIGSQYVCVDGPVYSWAELKELPPEL